MTAPVDQTTVNLMSRREVKRGSADVSSPILRDVLPLQRSAERWLYYKHTRQPRIYLVSQDISCIYLVSHD
jgi:hypothetical protein